MNVLLLLAGDEGSDEMMWLQRLVNFHCRRHDLYVIRLSCGIDRVFQGKKVLFALVSADGMCVLEMLLTAGCRDVYILCECVAIQLLKDKQPGSFIVRNSSSFQGSFGLAVKVAQLPPNVQVKGGS